MDGEIDHDTKTTGKAETKQATKELTPKQLHFCRCVASGMSQAAAYREAYNCKADSLSKTQQEQASRLMANRMVRARVEALIRARERAIVSAALSDRERVLTKLRDMMDNAGPNDGPKIRATELLGRTAGMFKDVVEQKTQRSTEEIRAELAERLAQLDTPVNIGTDDDDMHGDDEQVSIPVADDMLTDSVH